VSYSINNTGNANTFANVTFTPQYDGGYGVSNYTVTSNTGIAVSSSNTTITVNGLTKGNTYTFTAVAVNAVGTGKPSNVSIAITPVTVPSTPVITSASFINCTQANISISVSDNGGNAITKYTVVSSPCNITANSTTSNITLSGLNGCNYYTFTVTANNYVGVSGQTSVNNVSANPPPGYLYGWGQNATYGDLGICCNSNNVSIPTRVGNLSTWISVSGGYRSALAIRTDKTLWSWGRNIYGQLGLGNTTNYSSPVQIGALTNWAKITNAWFTSTAVKTDGTLWTWGYNNYGQLGLGNTTCYSSPRQVGALTNWAKITNRYLSTFAIKTDGTLWAWGYNGYGTLGTGDVSSRYSPVQIGACTNWRSLSPGSCSLFIVAIKTDGTLWSWGQNNQGQLGIGNNNCNYSSPKQVGALTNWKFVSQTGQDITAVKTDGTLWAWGQNNYGQLGLGNITKYSSPKQVGALTNWKITGGQTYAGFIALKTNGTLWSWGYNSTYYSLGLGNATCYSSPKQVGALTTWTNISAKRLGGFAVSAS
jgi:alpha-tubulin suppressor-like RCC1 family protein